MKVYRLTIIDRLEIEDDSSLAILVEPEYYKNLQDLLDDLNRHLIGEYGEYYEFKDEPTIMELDEEDLGKVGGYTTIISLKDLEEDDEDGWYGRVDIKIKSLHF